MSEKDVVEVVAVDFFGRGEEGLETKHVWPSDVVKSSSAAGTTSLEFCPDSIWSVPFVLGRTSKEDEVVMGGGMGHTS